MSRKGLKFWVYVFIVSLPLILLIAIFTSLIFQIVYINALNYGKIESKLETYLYGEGGSDVPFKIENGVRYYNYNDGVYGGTISNGKIVFDYSPEDYLIYVFGGSSAIYPNQDSVFSYYLEKKLNELEQRKVRVFNFARSGADSNTIKQRMISTINIKEPDLIIIYSGHNDYNVAYRRLIKPHFFLISKNFILNNLLKIIIKGEYIHKINRIENIDGKVTAAFQGIRLLNIRPGKFETLNEMILYQFSYNMNDIINITNEEKIPIIFVTPISNLDLRPSGINKITGNFYLNGINEKNYTKRVNYLSAAKDSELFSFNIRAKSELNDYLRNLKNENLKNVYILDLEKDLINEKFEFDYNWFSDGVHLRQEGHRVVASHLYNFIIKNRFCCD